MGNSVKEFVCRQIGVALATPDEFNYRKTGTVDSLGLVRLILSIEAKFQIMFTDEDVSKPEFNTVGGLVNVIKGKIACSK
jgi:acyl carrier protein